jgi:hypothetical protein
MPTIQQECVFYLSQYEPGDLGVLHLRGDEVNKRRAFCNGLRVAAKRQGLSIYIFRTYEKKAIRFQIVKGDGNASGTQNHGG